MSQRFVALLRGINVGGKNKVDMKILKKTFENCGYQNVITYINTGNIIFTSEEQSRIISKKLEEAIEADFGLSIKVLIRDFSEIESVVNSLPEDWQNNKEMKCDVMFLWEEIDDKKILEEIVCKDFETIKYLPGTLISKIDRAQITKSGIQKIASKKIYKKMTIRNVNTTRKILEIMTENQ